ncbi:MAG: hypothetical protein KIT72_05920 [Polyangiaceae bacterium]|nr:hypothetical protein [Polyangiaceae bacterium]MCW5789937.1 hypothetical protein [Polyangiaceae bacterium]
MTNPYAAPQFPGDGPSSVSGGFGDPTAWTPTGVLSQGFEIFKLNWVPLFFGPLIVALAGQIPSQGLQMLVAASGMHPESPEALGLTVLGAVIGHAVGTYFQVGQIRMFLQAARGNTPDFAVLFSGGDRFVPVLIASLIGGLGVALGLILLIVPGVILAIGWYFAPYLIVERNCTPMEALKRSWALCDGQKGKLFTLALLSVPLVLVGYLACCIGVFAAISVISIAYSLVYLHLTGER